VAIPATHELPILPLRRGKKMEEIIGNPGVKLDFMYGSDWHVIKLVTWPWLSGERDEILND